MTEQQQLPDIWGILRRRKTGFVFFFVLVFVAALVTAFVLPPVYISKTTILVEGQQIPSEYVRTTVTSYVEERLQIITQQVMSRTKLMEIINNLKLYTDMQKRYTWGEIIAKMRNDISLKTISAERGGKGGSSATIAFSLSYEGRNPSTVQKVANLLASLYLEENVRTREKRAATTTEYLKTELQHSKDEVDAMEQRISKFKMVHMGELPGHSQTNIQTLERLAGTLEQIALRMRSLEERKVIIQGQLTYVRSQVPAPGTEGAMASGPDARLRYLRVQLAALQSKYSDKHPDVKSLKNEIKELESQLSATSDIAGLEKDFEKVKAELADLKARYGEKHPDVVSKTKEVQALAEEVRAQKAQESNALLAAGSADNPAEFNLKTQIMAIDMEIKNLVTEKEKIKRRMEVYQAKVERAPDVEREFIGLTRDYEHAKHRYNDIMTKLIEAKAAQSLEESQRGERFTIIEPAQFPEKPFKPNRVAVVLVGLVLAIGAGAGYAAGREALDQSIKTTDELAALAGLPVLSVVSIVETKEDQRKRRIKIIVLIVTVVAVIVAGLILIHVFYKPLDILWIKIQKRMMRWI